MGKLFTPFENFVFKAFNFSGRATLLEYWLVMPVIWGLILFLLWGDAVELGGMLLARQVPPLNPLYWDGIVVFLLTIIPRLTLTVRRLHDSGKSGKWAKLPYLTFFFSFYLVIGLATAMASMNLGGDPSSSGMGSEIAAMGFLMAVAYGNMDTAWDALFAAAAVINAIGLDAIWGAISEMTASAPKIDPAATVNSLANGIKEAPTESGMMMIVAIMMVAAPFVTLFLHFFFMISPTKPDSELDKHGPIAGASLRKKGVTSDNPFAGYKYLYEKSPEQVAAHKAFAQQEIKSLYQQRVLGQEQTS